MQKLTDTSWAQPLLAWRRASQIMRPFDAPQSASKKGTQGWSVCAVAARITRRSPAWNSASGNPGSSGIISTPIRGIEGTSTFRHACGFAFVLKGVFAIPPWLVHSPNNSGTCMRGRGTYRGHLWISAPVLCSAKSGLAPRRTSTADTGTRGSARQCTLFRV